MLYYLSYPVLCYTILFYHHHSRLPWLDVHQAEVVFIGCLHEQRPPPLSLSTLEVSHSLCTAHI